MKIKTFPNLTVDFPEQAILSRLGYSRHRAAIDEAQALWLAGAMRSGFATCRSSARYLLTEILSNNLERLVLSGDKELYSRDFAIKCHGAKYLLLMAATAGKEIVLARDGALSQSIGTVYDAVGSEVADAAMNWVHLKAQQELLRMNLAVDQKRFSAGYGDMDLKYQKYFVEDLKMAEMGIKLTPEFIMNPEKTVTAVAPVREIG